MGASGPRYYPPPRKRHTGLIILAILIVVMIVVAAYVITTLPKDNEEVLDSLAWYADTDGDRYPDTGIAGDAFPNNSSEWADANRNGIGDNSETHSSDNDSDGWNDLVDLRDDIDVGLRVDLTSLTIVDEVDLLTGLGNVYFNIDVNGKRAARIDDGGYPYMLSMSTSHNIGKSLRFNIDDNCRYTEIAISMVDEDFASGDDLIDIDGLNAATKTLNIMYDLLNETWYGDNANGVADGSLDGTGSSDDDDGILIYDISIVQISGLKTFSWEYDGDDYELSVNIDAKDYYNYKYSDTERWPEYVSQAVVFVTVDDSPSGQLVQEVADELADMASNNGFSRLERANFVLAFVQSIDYSYDNVSIGADEYWRFPLETLYDETGDCEDTSILYASIMESMDEDAVLLLLPGHMAAAINVPGASGDRIYRVSGSSTNYYYCETTGPGWEVGDVPPEMRGFDADLVIQVPASG